MKKGFTLIELLAVIFILSILTLLTVNVISTTVKDSKEELSSAQILLLEKSAQLWGSDNIDMLPNAETTCEYITLGTLKNSGYVNEDTFDLSSMEKLSDDIKIAIRPSNIDGKVVYKYEIVTSELNNCVSIYEKFKYTVTFNTAGGTEIASVLVQKYDTVSRPKNPQKHEYKFREWLLNNVPYDFDTPVTGNITLTAAYDLTDQYTLMAGQDFNKAVKTLVKGSTVSTYTTNDTTVEYIKFYSNGELPTEFTLSQLQALPSTVVSATGETIKAYYSSANKAVYIYSNGEIVWNSDTQYIFAYFKNIRTFEVPYNVTSIGSYAFRDCSSLASIAIPNGVTSIENYAFYECSSLASIAIPNSVTSIGGYAFRGCSSLASIAIPNGVTSIGSYAFYGCSNLTSIAIPNSVTSIGSFAFNKTNLASITVDSNNTVYEDRNSNAIIKKSTNELIIGCKNTTIPSTVTKIGDSAFSECTGLTSITIPNSVLTIGNYAFSRTSLTSITIPSSVRSINSSAFSIASLASITVDSNNTVYEDRNSNAIIEKSTNKLKAGCKNTTIPNTVTGIDSYAFAYSNLTSITIPNSVTSIGNYAFAYSNLTSITIPNSVTSIGGYAFYYSSGLTSITIPNSVTSIGTFVFYGCSRLTSISFAAPTGWWYASSSTATSGTSLDLSNSSQNATYFKSMYQNKYWKRSTS